jgi:hypothetical protein
MMGVDAPDRGIPISTSKVLGLLPYSPAGNVRAIDQLS